MKKNAIWLIVSFIFFLAGLVMGKAMLARDVTVQISSDAVEAHSRSSVQANKTSGDQRCGRYDPFNHNDEAYKEYLRSQHGYPADLPLDEAINQFNIKSSCSELGKSQVVLTKEELLTAVRDALITQKKKLHPLTVEAFDKLSKQQIMPKGSLIDVDMGYQHSNYDISYWNIYLLAGLDRQPREPHSGDEGETENFYFIRKHFISSKSTKTANQLK